MAAKKVKLLLNKSVESLGIVGDIVKVRPGFARNYLLPQALAEAPTPSKIERLKSAREAALAELAELRKDREALVDRMQSVSIAIQRSCNDQGILYGSVTQRDIADALQGAGYGVDVRAVRLSQSIRRIGEYHVPIQFERDLRTDVTINVEPDRAFEEDREEMEFDEEGELIEKKPGRGSREGRPPRGARGERAGREGREAAPSSNAESSDSKPEKVGKTEAPIKHERPARASRKAEVKP